MVVILTWDNKQDMDVVRKENGYPMTFDGRSDAILWADANDSKLCGYMKIVDLTE